MIQLGIIDADVPSSAVAAYLDTVKKVTRQDWGNKLRGEENNDWVTLRPNPSADAMTVSEVQRVLRDTEFFPGGTIDGICGYRTTAAIRLFQEYVRSVEKDASIGNPDGKAGRNTFGHLARWRDSGKKADWAPAFQAWQSGTASPATAEYQQWLDLLQKVKGHYLSSPSRMLRMVNEYPHPSDTAKVAQWDFNPRHIHMVGIRRGAGPVSRGTSQKKFDDVIVLLIRGLVFKFQGSTEPGHTKNPAGAPFLVQGQHNYHFGWHLLSARDRAYQALKPASSRPSGVLVVRSKNDFVLSDADLDNGLERNDTINVHWGGEGGSKLVKNWSEGCQVITGIGYINHLNQPVDCSSFVAINSGGLGDGKTKGAYTVLGDLVAAFSSDISSVVKYMLLVEDDLKLSPAINTAIEQARAHARTKF